jgi:acyl transferase domain-containing protein/acyl-CoA synthetase (AMP-forming)/AMP-acid ligase II/SAM-dependent methyltransferase/acyl carrier protein
MPSTSSESVAGTLIQLLQARAEEGTNKGYAFVSDTTSPEVCLSFMQLDRCARAVAAVLQERGLAGKRAFLCYPAGVDFLVGLFGCLYAGMVAVPVYPPRASRADGRLDSISANAVASLVLTSTKVFRDRARLTAHAPRLRNLDFLDTAAVSESGAERWSDPNIPSDDLAILQYTSGSTGLPKGVMLTHAALLHNLARMRDVLGLSHETPGVCWLPAFHDMGLIGNFLQAVFCNSTLTFLSPLTFAQDPLFWLQLVSSRRAYVSGGPTFAFQHCLQRLTPEKCQGLDLSCWQMAYVGAEPVSAAVLDRFAEAFAPYGFRREAFFPCYGLAEATLMVTGGDRAVLPVVRSFCPTSLGEQRAKPDEAGRAMVGCGQPLPDLEVRIVDPATTRALPEGHIGEIWVSGPSVARGYWDRPEESEQTFQARCPSAPDLPFLRTGDRGFFHEGELFVSGRSKDLLIVRGRNYYPHDLETAVLEACPELNGHAGAAFTVEDTSALQVVMVHEVARDYKPGNGQLLLTRIRETIAELFDLEIHKLVLVKTGTMPRSSSGKTQCQECARRLQAGELSVIEELLAPDLNTLETRAPDPAPAGVSISVTDWLVARLARHLSVPAEQIDVRKPFAACGLDSLAMVNLAADLQRWLGRPLSPTLLYSAPTIAALARAIEKDALSPLSLEGEVSEVRGFPAQVPIAVVGIGCRFPTADGPDSFWQVLATGRCVVGELPVGRWQRIPDGVATTRGGYLGDVQCFDAPFFGIAPREAVFIDPQHRLLLEVAWEALEHAGVPADRLAGRSVGVFMGVSNNDYGRLLAAAGSVDAYIGVGNSASMAAHRLSYHLDLRGPSMAIDTACSSSLVAVHLACQSLRTGECELALAGGINLILTPDLTAILSHAAMLSPAGRCKTFDASADGYVRGEGCGIVVLKSLPAAVRDGDLIYAVLEASAVNQDGKSNGITAPNGAVQTELIQRVLRLAARSGREVTAIEAHGTGTSLGDPIEFDALNAALGSATTPCALGAVKTNLGHLEAAAGIAGLIKTVLQIHHGQIAPHLHLETLNPHIGLKGSRFHIPQAAMSWPGPRLGGVSSFGFGGTNAHVLVAQAPSSEEETGSVTGSLSPFLLPLSARSPAALKASALRYADWLREHPEVPLGNVCMVASRGRCHFEHRLAVSGGDANSVAEALAAWAKTEQHPECQAGHSTRELSGRVAFLFTGQGAHYASMGQQLYETCRVFRDTLDLCDRTLKGLGVGSVREALQDSQRLEQTDIVQPALFALEYALAQTWRHWGIEPAALLGHSVGEYVAACVAGVLGLEDGLKLIAQRGKLMQSCPEGRMLACFAPLEEVRSHVQRWGDTTTIAVINGPENVVVSGEPAGVAVLREQLAAYGIESRFLKAQRAFHSPLMKPALSGLQECAAAMPHHAPTIPLVSNLTGTFFTSAPTAAYWAEHAWGTVQFEAGLKALHEAGITHFVEVGPDAILCRLGPPCLPGSTKNVWLPSLRRGKEDWKEMLGSLGRLYVDGAKVDWERFSDEAPWQRLPLPTYPFEQFRYWIDHVGQAFQPDNPVRPESLTHWRPWSSWAQRLPRKVTGFDRLEGIVAPVMADVRPKHPIETFALLRQEFDELAGACIVATLEDLGWHPYPGEQIRTDLLGGSLQVVKPYDRLLDRLLQIAAEDGWLKRTGNGWRVVRMPPLSDIDDLFQKLLWRFPGFEAELRLANRCSQRMPQVMRGEADPLEVLFGEEAASWTARLYRESPLAQFYNDLVVGAVRQLLSFVDNRSTVRILEIGAGTGGTTAHLLPMLPRDRVEYVFTDVSKLFVAQASSQFQEWPFVHYGVLDVEKDPAVQGFADGQFDLILAANVLHATTNLEQSVRTTRRLLAPGGVLVLLEGTGPRRLLDLIFGLTEGWWKFADLDLRPQYPLLAPSSWEELLSREGFADCTWFPAADTDLADPDQVVVLARSAGDRERTPPISSLVATTWVLADDHLGLADGLRGRLEQDGDTVLRSEDVAGLGEDIRSHTGTSIHLVEFAGGAPIAGPAAKRFSQTWIISRGSPVASPSDARRIDLDPNQSLEEQADCLYEALRHPDEHAIVAYRGDQRYIPCDSACKKPSADKATDKPPILDRQTLLAAAASERRQLVEDYLRREFHHVLGVTLSTADLEKPPQAFGLDSLMGIQLRNRIETHLGIALSVVDFLKGLSLHQIISKALKTLGETASAAGQTATPAAPPPDLTSEKVDQLPEETLNTLLDSLLSR